MEDNVSKIKDRLDVVDVISGYLKLQKAGINFKARCPFHNEKTPSFVVSPERQVWHCFGCSKGGDIFSFVQDIEGVEFPEALRVLAAKAGIELESFNPAVKDDKTKLYEVCESATKFFEKQFLSSTGKLALEYLKNRGVAEPTIQEFRLGFAPNDWNALGTFLKNCGYSEDEIVEAGLAIKRNDGSGIYDRFRSRITFPIFDLNGQVVGFTGRIFESDDKEAAKYINTPQTRIYDKGRILYGLNKAKMDIKQADQCVLVEGNMDALMSHQAGVKNVVASSGTALTPGHLTLLHRYTTNLGFCFDTDQAGARATKRGIGLALSQNFNIKVIEINDKECKDPADLVKKNAIAWSSAVSQAKPVLEFYFNKAKAGFDPNSAESKKSVISALAPFLKRLTSQVEKAHWLTQLAFFLRAKEEAIEADVAVAKDDLEAYDREPAVAKVDIRPAVAADPLSETLLSLIMKNPILFKNNLKNINPELLDSYTAEAIVKLTTINSDNIADLLKDFREKNQSYKLEFAYLKSQELWKDSKDEELKVEFNNLINKLEERHLRAKLEKIGFEMRAGDDKEKKLALAIEANKILSRLGKIQKI
ncbi:MAG: primase protein [Candidatus Azambacteria bacterium GW2011_GWA1_44_9]|uniref:DNA primase n=1 Tax=Candidatus Azambacteria bacterium GW2011_GWA1_44_9 TaxID=1618610 RepID=A0A0G1MKI9_9BACT|nr:MAG: primase protein [Candidatus Azambacteria bacterium GW2011_GWA1_44_9]